MSDHWHAREAQHPPNQELAAHRRRLHTLAAQLTRSELAPVAAGSSSTPGALASGLPQRVTAPSAWVGDELLKDEDSWRIHLGPAELAELRVALATIVRRVLRPPSAALDDLPLGPACSALGERIRTNLNTGRGFSLLHGFPAEAADEDAVGALYYRFCREVGVAVTQNSEAGLIHKVTDGAGRPQQGGRGVGNPGPVKLHVDLTDCVSLLCVRQAPDDPHSCIGSTPNLYNRIVEERPEFLDVLRRGYRWTRQGEALPHEG